VADKKALAEKKAAAAEKAIADKEAAEEKRIARANPERIWVQVAGGATESDLPKAWKAVKAKAPTVFAARSGWTTPLRATNRVLTGPFKTDAEARSFVNQLAKGGVSAFTFTSEPGQSVTRLPAK
ncbi:MAG: SPOR domain-containing protein, partial [Sphingomonas sp.]